jgi:hypothetical protein
MPTNAEARSLFPDRARRSKVHNVLELGIEYAGRAIARAIRVIRGREAKFSAEEI